MKEIAVTLLVAVLLFAFFVPPSSSQSSEPRIEHGSAMGMMHWRGENQCWKATDLNLSPDQLKTLDAIRQTYFLEAQRLRGELFSKRLEFREYLTNPAVKVDSIHAKSSEIIELQAKVEEKATDYLINVRNLLTPEQLKLWCPERELPNLRPMRPMMDRPYPTGPRPPR
jgi:Spy/CpxP family protein refolding chaperone